MKHTHLHTRLLALLLCCALATVPSFAGGRVVSVTRSVGACFAPFVAPHRGPLCKNLTCARHSGAMASI